MRTNVKRMRDLRRRKRAEGYCAKSGCWQPHSEGKSMCLVCRERRNADARERMAERKAKRLEIAHWWPQPLAIRFSWISVVQLS